MVIHGFSCREIGLILSNSALNSIIQLNTTYATIDNIKYTYDLWILRQICEVTKGTYNLNILELNGPTSNNILSMKTIILCHESFSEKP